MDEDELRKLLRDTSHALGQEDPEAFGSRGFIEVEGVLMHIFHHALAGQARLHLYVELGDWDEARRPAVHAELLKLNLLSGSRTRGVFALDPDSGRALLVSYMPMPADGTSLAQALRAYADTALDVHRHFKTMGLAPAAPGSRPQPDLLA